MVWNRTGGGQRYPYILFTGYHNRKKGGGYLVTIDNYISYAYVMHVKKGGGVLWFKSGFNESI